jgi:hypothetical protein
MSFKCEKCNKQQPAGQPVNFVVTETRQKTYSNEIVHGKMRGTIEESVGTEIVREIRACPACYRELTGLDPLVIVPVAAVAKAPKVHQREDHRERWRNPRHGKGNRDQNKDQRPQRPAPVVEVVNKLTFVKE